MKANKCTSAEVKKGVNSISSFAGLNGFLFFSCSDNLWQNLVFILGELIIVNWLSDSMQQARALCRSQRGLITW